MKAVICPKYGPPEVLQVKELEKPVPRKDEILVKVHATTVSVADCRVRGFNVPISFWLPARFALGLRKPKNPVFGAELAGEVEAVDKAVKRFKKGDHVFAVCLPNFGAYAEYKCLPEEGIVDLKPANLSWEEAAAFPIGARTALHYLKRGKLKKGQKVLIYGASGSVGTYAVQLAKYFGAEVTGVCSSKNLDLLKSLGAERVIDYTEASWQQELERYDMIFIVVDKWPFADCHRFLKKDGVYMNVTNPVKSLAMFWMGLTSKKRFIMGENPPETAKELAFLKELVEKGILRPVMDRSYPLEQIVEAHRYVEKGHKKGNVAIRLMEETNRKSGLPEKVALKA